ncbi:amidohydrolase [Agarivorans litoreus]|uniref:amidohydrolase n=1 Tax=Agarivorans litoreus TaxID=1510455 RepID=UPI001C7DF92B|nr:amidohydrolase [Agarivorans litoreus]
MKIRSTLLLGHALCALLANSAMAALPSEQVLEAVEEMKPTIEKAAQKLWDLSEISLFEESSSAYLKSELEKHGFKITSEGTGNVPTAFIAEYGSGEPKLGIMMEYDALPGLGNQPVAMKQPRNDGITAGHACGHNLIGASALGAALSLKNIMQEKGIKGTLRVYGGAAEETEGAKVYMAREGVFNDLDAMLHSHPLDVAMVANIATTAQSQMYIEFTGVTAHAGQSPWLGRSALDAVELFLHGVNSMREHVKPTARIHYVITNGGISPNIVPEKASVKLTFREASRADVDAGVAWIKEMAEGAALMTQTKALAVDYYGMYDLLPNTPMAERVQKHFELVGVPKFTKEEQDFAKAIQTVAGVTPTGMTTSVLPLPNEPKVGGSTDVGDISWIVPTMGVVMPSIPEGISVHTWMATASHGTSIGYKAAMTAAQVLALTGADILTDEALREDMKADFDKRTQGFTYVSPLPDIIKEPVGLPDAMRKHGTIGDLKEAVTKQAEDDDFDPED